MSEATPENVLRVRDNGGSTFDRYTVVLADGTSPGCLDMLGLSIDPASPLGFSQWGEGVDGDHLGAIIAWSDLPATVRSHANARLAE